IGITGANLTACEDAENRRDLVADAQRRIIQDEAAIDAAQKKRDLDRSVQHSVIDAARLNVTVAENKAGLASTDRRYNIEEEQQVVDQAEADVVTAQHAFDATIMKSSFSGIVERINGNVGQVVNASYNTASPASARQPSGGAFIVLKNVNSFQLVLPFSQADVAGMQPNQPAEVSFDDIARLSRKGIVTSIEPAQPAMGANTTYLVTVVLTELDPSLKDGMTAQVHLVISAVDNVLVVPTSAVHRHGRISTVSVLQSDGKQRDVPVELGEAGKETTHVVSGIREGDQVVLPRG
ncbi:MAG: efflux RND transporter periplasmic adaptor subunit, partial [Pseudonocardiaceae bacterium]